MPLIAHSRSSGRTSIWARAVLASVALLAVLAARSVPPNFPEGSSFQSKVSATSHHDQRPRFDHSGSKWSAPADSFLLVPPATESPRLAPTPRLSFTLQSRGFHYNRPPHLS
jgi:hypothetical protein